MNCICLTDTIETNCKFGCKDLKRHFRSYSFDTNCSNKLQIESDQKREEEAKKEEEKENEEKKEERATTTFMLI